MEYELGIGEELVERMIHPDGHVEERIVRRTAATRSRSHEIAQATPDLPPPTPAGYHLYWFVARTSSLYADALELGVAMSNELLNGIHSSYPWKLTGTGPNWLSWTTHFMAGGLVESLVRVDLIVSPPERSDTVLLRVNYVRGSTMRLVHKKATRTVASLIIDRLKDVATLTLPDRI